MALFLKPLGEVAQQGLHAADIGVVEFPKLKDFHARYSIHWHR